MSKEFDNLVERLAERMIKEVREDLGSNVYVYDGDDRVIISGSVNFKKLARIALLEDPR